MQSFSITYNQNEKLQPLVAVIDIADNAQSRYNNWNFSEYDLNPVLRDRTLIYLSVYGSGAQMSVALDRARRLSTHTGTLITVLSGF
jgi:hypothetical protein